MTRGGPVDPHRYLPRVVGTGHSAYVRPTCSCGWEAPSRLRGPAKALWREHRREATA